MTGAHDRCGDLRPSSAASETEHPPPRVARVLVVDADAALLGLLEEWLVPHGCNIVAERAGADHTRDGFDLIVVDVPFPRARGLDVLQRVRRAHPCIPVLALSANFFASIDRSGTVAQTLGVASVLPKPVTRAALIAAVRHLLPNVT
jgi:CheY-like chemotaxis protein